MNRAIARVDSRCADMWLVPAAASVNAGYDAVLNHSLVTALFIGNALASSPKDGTLAHASTWPDRIRKAVPVLNPLHYVDVPRGSTTVTVQRKTALSKPLTGIWRAHVQGIATG